MKINLRLMMCFVILILTNYSNCKNIRGKKIQRKGLQDDLVEFLKEFFFEECLKGNQNEMGHTTYWNGQSQQDRDLCERLHNKENEIARAIIKRPKKK